MMISVVLDGENDSIQAPCNEVCNSAQKVSDQTFREIFSEQRVNHIAILTIDIIAFVNN